jgi:hypothetical protein
VKTRGPADVNEACVDALLRESVRAWDEWRAGSLTEHGAEATVRQEARRIARTLTLLDAAPRRLLEIGTGYLTLAGTLRHAFPQATITGVDHPGRAYVFTPAYRKALEAARIVFATSDLVVDGLPFRARATRSPSALHPCVACSEPCWCRRGARGRRFATPACSRRSAPSAPGGRSGAP